MNVLTQSSASEIHAAWNMQFRQVYNVMQLIVAITLKTTRSFQKSREWKTKQNQRLIKRHSIGRRGSFFIPQNWTYCKRV